VRPGRVIVGGKDRGGDHDRQAHQPPEHERRAFSHATLGGQHDQERRERDRVECYRHADQDEVKRHSRPFRLTLTEGVGVDEDKLHAAASTVAVGPVPATTVQQIVSARGHYDE